VIAPAKVHNAVGLLVDLYGGLLAEQAAEIARLREQVEYLTVALKRATLVDDVGTSKEGLAGGLGGRGQAPVEGRPIPEGSGSSAEGSRAAQGDPQVEQVEGGEGPVMTVARAGAVWR